MKNLIARLENKNQETIKRDVESFKTELKKSSDLTMTEKYTLNRKSVYKKNRELQVKNRIIEIRNKKLKENLDKIKQVNEAHDKLPNDIVITINFYKNNTWGYCPKGNDNYGNSTDSITGCGYCKESTATAQLLNQNEMILKRLYEAENDMKQLGYGYSNHSLPTFSGGVGVSCHVRILEQLGYKVTQSGNDSTTVLIISEV